MKCEHVLIKQVKLFPGMLHHHVFVDGVEVPGVKEVSITELVSNRLYRIVVSRYSGAPCVYETDGYVFERAEQLP